MLDHMERNVRCLLLLTMALSLPFNSARSSDYLSITTEHAPPNNMIEHGEEVGAATQALEAALRYAGIDYGIVEYPWKRAYREALLKPNTCVYSATMTDQRKPLFKWVGPILHDNWVAFATDSSPLRIERFEDLHAYRLGTSLGSARSTFLREYNLVADEAADDELNVNLLQTGRIDLWITSQRRGAYFLEKHKVRNIKRVFFLKHVEYYMACNKYTSDSLIQKVNAAFPR